MTVVDPEPPGDPADIRLRRDLELADFTAGVAAGCWRLVDYRWPWIYVAVTGGDGKELGMRLLVDNYPVLAPGGEPWDLEAKVPLATDRWPTGGHSPQIFRPDWSPGNKNAPYMACDRTGLAGHNWATANPARAWTASRTIAFYVSEIWHELRGANLPSPPHMAA